jgi:hypothetical protein
MKLIKHQIGPRVDTATREALERLAAARGVSIGNYAAQALTEHVRRHQGAGVQDFFDEMPETGGPARRFLDARRGALHGRDKRSVRRSRWRARAGGARAATYGGGEGEAVSLGGAENGETVRAFSAE